MPKYPWFENQFQYLSCYTCTLETIRNSSGHYVVSRSMYCLPVPDIYFHYSSAVQEILCSPRLILKCLLQGNDWSATYSRGFTNAMQSFNDYWDLMHVKKLWAHNKISINMSSISYAVFGQHNSLTWVLTLVNISTMATSNLTVTSVKRIP